MSRSHQSVRLVLGCLFVACAPSRGSTEKLVVGDADSRVATTGETPRVSDTSKAPAPARSPRQDRLGLARLRALGFELSELDTQHVLMCGAGGESCICLQPLACSARDDCSTLEESTVAFRAALERPAAGHKVYCDQAEVGRCEGFQYFSFRGDLHRNQTQWFDAEHKLVAVYSYSDYAAYCDGAARILVEGDLPDCLSPERQQLFCGKGRPPLAPLQALRFDVLSNSERVGPARGR